VNEVEIVVRSNDQTRGGFASASDHAKRFAGAAVGALKLVGGAAVATGVAAVGLGVKTASGLEQARIGFTTMLGSAAKADAFLKQLQKFAAATPFEFPELTRASQRLIAMGINAKDVIPYMTAIGDAVAGLGGGAEQIDQVTTAIGQMSAKGKIQSDEILQLTEAGIPALKILAAQYHTSAGNMQDMITKGKVMAADALPKLIDGMEHGTKATQGFGGMMEKQSHSLAGLWSTLKDNVSQALAKAIEPMIPTIERVISYLSEKIPTAIDKMVSFFKRHQEDLKAWGRKAVEVFQTAKDDIEKMRGSLLHAATALGMVATAAGAAKIAIKAFSIASSIAAATNPFTVVLALMAAAAAAFVVLYTRSDTFRTKVNGALASVRDWFVRNKAAMVNFGLSVATWGLRIVSVALDIIAVWAKLESVLLRVAADIVAAWVKVISTILDLLSHLPFIGSQFAHARDAVNRFGGDAVKGLRAAATGADKVAAAAARAATKARDLANGVKAIKDHNIAIGILDRFTASFNRIITRARDEAGRAISITVGTGGHAVTANAHGGIIGAAGGGPRSAMTWVGEQGPELVRLPYGSTVYPSGQSMGMASGGGSDRQVVIQVQPGGTALDQMFIDWLRTVVRHRGGVGVVFE
jgi:tape measure domain-containing protein